MQALENKKDFGEFGIFGKWFWGVWSPEDHQIWSKQLSLKQFPTCWVSTFYVEQLKSFILEKAFSRSHFREFAPQMTPNLANVFLHYEFQLSMLSSSKVSFLGVHSHPQGPPNLVQTIASQTTSYIVSFNFLCSAIKSWTLERLFLGGGGLLPQIWSKQFSHKQLPTLWVSTFYVEQLKSFILGVFAFQRRPLN